MGKYFGMVRQSPELFSLSHHSYNKISILYYIGWFKIKSQNDSKVITIVGGQSSNEGAEIASRSDQNTDNQLWKWEGNVLVSKHRGYAMEMMDDSGRHGFNSNANHYTGDKDQQWEFELVLEGGGYIRNLGTKRHLTRNDDFHWKLHYVSRRAQKPMEEFVDEEDE